MIFNLNFIEPSFGLGRETYSLLALQAARAEYILQLRDLW